jgi:hypothetical protein
MIHSKLLIAGAGLAFALTSGGPLSAGEMVTQKESMHRFADKSAAST